MREISEEDRVRISKIRSDSVLKFVCELVLWTLVLVLLIRNREPYCVERYLLCLFTVNSCFMVAKLYCGFITAKKRQADVTKGYLYGW